MATNGRTIIEEALALCSYVTKHPDPTKWFDNAGSSGNTDDRIGSTHDAVYDEVKPMTVIQEILEKAKNPAAIQGFDAYETPSGVIIGHLRNSLDFTSPIASITPESYSKSEDTHRVRNKIKVYGKADRKYPVDGDSLTEQNASETPADDGWTSNGTLTWGVGIVGDDMLSAVRSNVASVWALNTLPNAVSAKFPKEFKSLRFWLYINASVGNLDSVEIRIRAPNEANYFRYFLYNLSRGWQSQEIEIKLGPTVGWVSVGNPDWGNLTAVFFELTNSQVTTNVMIGIDGLHFGDACFSGSAEDSASQAAYGVRMPEPVVDEALKSDAECQARAESILAVLKDPVITLSDIVVDGDHRYRPGDRLRIIVSNDNLDAYFRIVEVRHEVKGSTWDAILTLSNEPQQIDYVFRLLKEAQKLLERK